MVTVLLFQVFAVVKTACAFFPTDPNFMTTEEDLFQLLVIVVAECWIVKEMWMYVFIN